MSTNNLNNIDLNSLQDTQTFFNNYYLPALTVSQDIDDSIIGFFQQVTDTMFLNLNRIGTSYLGINNAPQTSKYVARTILP